MSYLTKLQACPFLGTNTGSLILELPGGPALDLGYARTSHLRNTDLLPVLEAIPGSSAFRYDSATKNFYLGDCRMLEKDLEMLPLQLSRKYGINFPSSLTRQAVEALAFQNSFDSYRQELENIEASVSPFDISRLSARYFKTDNPLYDKFLELWLVNWVKRLIEPGSYHRTMLVLQGPQNIGKDQFAKILAGPGGTTTVGCTANFSDKDLLTTFNSKSILIFDELEQTTGRVVEGALKSFLSDNQSNFVAKYKSHSEQSLRRFSCWGSCNKATFLTDSTGNTRFHVIPVNVDPDKGERINLDLLSEEREGIISGAIHLYRLSLEDDYCLQLSSREVQASERLNRSFLNVSTFEEPLIGFLEGRSTTCLAEVKDHLGFSQNHYDPRVDKELRTVLSILGWQLLDKPRNVFYSGGKRSVRPWVLKALDSWDFQEMSLFYECKYGRGDEF